MGIVNGIFGTDIKGSVGKVTFRKRNGKNVASQKVTDVKNPRTEAQQLQRMRMATVSAVYSKAVKLFDNAYEGVTYGAPSMAEFMRLNLRRMIEAPTNFAYNPRFSRTPLQGKYIVSKGTISQVQIEPTQNTYDKGGVLLSKAFGSGTNVADISLNDFMEKTGAKMGDQVTFVMMTTNFTPVNPATDITDPRNTYEEQNIVYGHFTIKPDLTNAQRATKLFLAQPQNNIFALPDTLFSESENMEYFGVANSLENNKLVIVPNGTGTSPLDDETGASCITIIISRKENDKWVRSNAYFELTEIGKEDLDKMAASVKVQSYLPSSPYYLNQAYTG